MTLKRLYRIIKRTQLLKMLLVFIAVFFIAALIVLLVEPDIHRYYDALWYTFVASTSIGFGDICPKTHIGRIVTVIITIYEILIASMVPGVVVTYYMEYLKIKRKETISLFLEKLENLPSLSPEELAEISEKVKTVTKK